MPKKALAISLAAAITGFFAFLRYYPAFGGLPASRDRKQYQRRNPYLKGNQFTYPPKWAVQSLCKDIRISKKKTVPQTALPVLKPDFHAADGLRVTWFGHSSVLLRYNNTNILIDPIFSQRCFPLQWMGPKRFSHPGIQPDDLPEIQLLLITHDHHDHLDPGTILAVDHKVQHYIVPLGVEKHLIRWGISPRKIHCLAWWEQLSLHHIVIACTPTRHFSGRRMLDQNRTQWCSYVLKIGRKSVFISGDGGYGAHFAEIHKRYSDMDFGIMECGQYNRRWHFGHLYPDESVQAAIELGVKCVLPVHWGVFVLSDHGWDDSPERFVRAANKHGLSVATPRLCETFSPDDISSVQTRWWRDIP